MKDCFNGFLRSGELPEIQEMLHCNKIFSTVFFFFFAESNLDLIVAFIFSSILVELL